jgi:hypothetical protein
MVCQMKSSVTAAAILAACLAGMGCGFQHSTSVTSPTAPSTPTPASGGAPSAGTQSLVGVWTSLDAPPAVPSPNTCGNFQYQIASQTASAVSGTFTAICGNLVVSGFANGQLSGTNVTIGVNGSGAMSGIPICLFNVTGNGSIEDGGYTLRIPYTGTTCLGPVHGTEVLRRPQPAAPPPPAPPAPPPTPAPAPPSGPTDGLDLSQAVVTGGSPGDIASWPITTTIDDMNFGNGISVDFSKKSGAGRWPDVVPPGWDGGIQYTLWIVENINGQWYTSGGVEYWYGLDSTGGPAAQLGSDWYYSPGVWGALANRQPANGELVGFFVAAGDERAKNVATVHERSAVVTMPFPSGGGYFTFSRLRTLRAR